MWGILLAVLVALPRVSLVVYPRVVVAGHSTHLECRVPRHPANRWLELGIVDAHSSLVQLDGDQGPVISVRVLDVPCLGDTATVYCVLTATDGVYHVTQSIGVVCQSATVLR